MPAPSQRPITSPTADGVPLDVFLAELSDSAVLPPAEVQSLKKRAAPARSQNCLPFVKELVKSGKLTKYQATTILRGMGRELTLDNYVVLDKLGEGGMGMVYKARHRKLGQVVALKVLSPAVTSKPTAVKRFLREVRAVSKLRHPNIVAASDAGEDKGTHFLVMEHVEGTDLAKLVKQSGPLAVSQACDCIRQAACGLAHAHTAGIIHRDVKPSNLLLDSKGVVKVLDLGLARQASEEDDSATQQLTQDGAILGTCDFMAPEQALNSKNADQRSDVYSLGCTLFYLLTGKSMYDGQTAMEKLMAHRESPIPPLPGAPAALLAVYRRMVAKNPEERIESMAKVIEALQAAQGSRPTPASSGLRWRRPVVVAGTAAVLLGLVALLLVLTGGGGKPTSPAPASQFAAPPRSDPHPVLSYVLKPCPADAVEFKGHWYKFYPDGISSWEAAHARCRDLGGYLACVQRLDEHQFLLQLTGERAAAWLGGTCDKSQKWSWITGEPWIHSPRQTPWLPHQPNNGGSAFLQLRDGGWHDIGPNEQRGYTAGLICEWERAADAETPAANPTQAVDDPARWRNAVNLLALVDPAKDKSTGNWKLEKGNLVSDAAEPAKIFLPYQPPEEYDLRVECTRLSGKQTVMLLLSKSGRQFGWEMGNGLLGFNAIDGGGRYVNPGPGKPSLESGQRLTSIIQVRKPGLKAYTNGTLVSELTTDYRNVSSPEFWNWWQNTGLGVGSWSSPTSFHRIEVLEVTGKGTFKRPDSSAPAEPINDPARWRSAVNLMAFIELDKDAVSGKWRKNDFGLASDNAEAAKLVIPYKPPEEYDFRIVFTRNEGDHAVAQVLSKDGRCFAWEMGLFPNKACGFNTVGGLGGNHMNNPTTVPGNHLTNGKRHTSIVQVRNTGLTTYLDGVLMKDHKTNYKDMGEPFPWRWPVPQCLGLGSWTSPTTFHAAEVLEVTGKGSRTRR